MKEILMTFIVGAICLLGIGLAYFVSTCVKAITQQPEIRDDMMKFMISGGAMVELPILMLFGLLATMVL